MMNGSEEQDYSSPSIGAFHTLAAAVHEGRAVGQSFETGARIAHYEIKELIGKGGFSNVYKVRHRYLDQLFALKTLNTEAVDQTHAERFLLEARTLALMRHPGVIRVFDAGLHEGKVPFIIIELLEGATLRERIKPGEPMAKESVLNLLEEIAQVLIYQEQLGVIHQDIKPSNIFITKDGRYCLSDYSTIGLATDKSQQHEAFASVSLSDALTGPTLGTPVYMAPEQFKGVATKQSDLFCLGMTALECLTGKPPRTPARQYDAIASAATQHVSLTELHHLVPREICAIIENLTAVDPANRYGTAQELFDDVQNYRYEGRPPVGPLHGNGFIAIPYKRSFRLIYTAIADALACVHLRPRRMDEITFIANIWGQIEQEILDSVVVIADFSHSGWRRQPNPNVITEAAHARAIGKKLIIITQNAPESLPFDWRHMPILQYRATSEGLITLKADLTVKLRELVKTTVTMTHSSARNSHL